MNQECKMGMNYAQNQAGLQNLFAHQLKGLSTPMAGTQMTQNVTEAVDCASFKPNNNSRLNPFGINFVYYFVLIALSIGLFPQLQFQNLLSAITNPFASLMGNNQFAQPRNM